MHVSLLADIISNRSFKSGDKAENSSTFDIEHFSVSSIFTAGKQALLCKDMLDPFSDFRRKILMIFSTESCSFNTTRPPVLARLACCRQCRLRLLIVPLTDRFDWQTRASSNSARRMMLPNERSPSRHKDRAL